MKYSLVETHAHLDMEEFDADREEAISRAKAAGVERIITIGIDAASSHRAVAIAKSNNGLFAAVGCHPHETEAINQEDIAELEKLAAKPEVVAIGEIGLDYHYQPVDKKAQIEVMQKQLALAQRLALPVIIHCRDAEEDMLALLNEWVSAYSSRGNSPIGVIHCFSGGLETAAKYMDMGFYISVGAYIGYPSSKKLRDVIKEIPLDRIMLETDSPFLPPQQFRGQRNEPSYIPFVLEVLADITGIDKEIIAKKTTQNAIRLFNID